MIPLSKAVMRMSTYDRTNQELNWYVQPFYLCTTERYAFDGIKEECGQRKIDCEELIVTERSMDRRKVLSEGVVSNAQKYPDERCNYHMLKIKMSTWKTAALERKQMADWAITTFNHGEAKNPNDLISYGVWIQPEREVYRMEADSLEHYEEGRVTHWV